MLSFITKTVLEFSEKIIIKALVSLTCLMQSKMSYFNSVLKMRQEGIRGSVIINQILIITFLFSFIFNERTNAAWISYPTGITSEIWAVDFLNAQTGVVVGNGGAILKSTNGGVNWFNVSPVFNVMRGVVLDYANPKGVACGHSGTLRTTNSGSNWFTSQSGNFYGMDIFWNTQTVYCVGSAMSYAKTTNWGQNWTTGTYTVSGTAGFDIYSVDQTYIHPAYPLYICGSSVNNGGVNTPKICSSTDNGVTFSINVNFPTGTFTGASLNDIEFAYPGSLGYCVSSNGRILRTTNGAASWDTTYVGNYDLRSIAIRSTDTAYVCGSNGKVFYTVNQGANWIAYTNTGTTQNLRGMDYADGYIWAVGTNGTLIKNAATVNEVSISGAITGNRDYECLSDAFNSLNSSSQAGADIVITINKSTTEPSTGAVLNQGSWNSLLIKPSSGSGKTVSGAIADGAALVDLNGADNVTIDGINTGGTSLTFSNSSISGASGTSTIRLRNDATNNRITNCRIFGSSRTNFTNPCATVLFGADAVSTGNDNNTISNCDIGPAGSNIPYCGIYFNGSTGSPTLNNSNDTIRNCNIYDYFNNVNQSAGIMIGSGNTSVSILGNKFYQTATRTNNSSGNNIYCIQINNTSGDNFRINGNVLGYNDSGATGYYTLHSIINGVNFHGIYVNAGTALQTEIKNNTMANILLTGNWNSATLINVVQGNLTVDSNFIGSQSSNSITFNTSTTLSSQHVTSIRLFGPGDKTASGNSIGGVRALAPVCNLFGIHFINNTGSTINISGNIVGGNGYSSLVNEASADYSNTNGIRAEGTGTGTRIISDNVIRNIRSNNSWNSSFNIGIAGIFIWLSSGTFVASHNLIHSIESVNPSQSKVSGLEVYSGAGKADGNFIHSLSVAGNNSVINGINSFAASCNYSNNMISLGMYGSDSIETNGAQIHGIRDLNTGSNYYHNSIYITGTAETGNANTFGISFLNLGNPALLLNNIFYNSRSNNGSSGKHYAMSLPGTSPNPPGITCNYNDMFADGNGGYLGYFNNADVSDLASWKSITGKDTNSISANPRFISKANLHIDSTYRSSIDNAGVIVASVTTDFDNNLRNASAPDIGADEFNSSIPGQALDFDGINDYVSLPASLALAFTAPSVSEITIEYWFKGSNVQSAVRFQLNSGNYIVSGWGPTPGNQKHLISTDGGLTGIPVGASVTDGNWHHVAMTWKRNSVNGFKSYLDGMLVHQRNSADVALPSISVAPAFGSQFGTSEFTNGSLDEVRIWTRALSQTEIALNRFKEIDSAQGLLASYHFNNGVASGSNMGISSLADLTGNHNGTLMNFALNGNTSNWIEPGPANCLQYVEINIRGNGITIPDGDMTPSVSDNTDFGTIAANTVLSKTFIIQNTGNDSMYIGQTFVTGNDSDKFIAGQISPPGKIPPGGSASFEITFMPASSGTKGAVVHILTNDCDESDYDFTVTGTGTAALAETLNFDGINDNVVLPVALTQSLTLPANSEITIEYWFKGSNLQSAVRFQTTGNNWIVAGWGTPGNQKHLISTEGGLDGVNVGASATDGNWHHVAMTWKKNTVNGFKSYLDGQLVEQKNSSNSELPAMTVNGYIGRYNAGSGEYMNGTIDNVRIWKRELSQTELESNRFLEINFGLGLLASYNFNQGLAGDDNTGITTLIDGTSNNYSGELTNFALNGFSSNWVVFGPALCSQSAEIEVKGNNLTITDGDSTVTVSNNTDFGTVAAGTSKSHTFVIKNTGPDSLITGQISVTGNDANKFSVGPVTPAGKIASGDSATFEITFTPDSSGTMYAEIHIPANDCDERDFDFAVRGTGVNTVSLEISVITEGYYRESTDLQNKSYTMKAYLHSEVSPYNIIDSASGTIDSVTHRGVFILSNASPGNYFISVTHMSSIETWSSSVQNISENTSYDFTTSASKAFGDNMKQVDLSPVRFAVYSGDVNQDGIIDGADGLLIDNDAANFESGYIPTDLNGDEIIDGSDALLADNNAANFVTAVTP